MTAVEKTAAVRDLLSANLPALLFTAGLDNFDEYLNTSPLRSNDKEIAVYIDLESNDVTTSIFGIIIQAQIYGKDQVQEYHSVIMPFLESNINGQLVEMTERIAINADVWPMEPNGSTAFAYYDIQFETELDDCIAGG